MGVEINPAFLSAYSKLESAAKDYKSIIDKYGEDSSEGRAAFLRRSQAESLFCSLPGIIDSNNSNKSKESAMHEVSFLMSNVNSWYV